MEFVTVGPRRVRVLIPRCLRHGVLA
jgi:hypothetical protein